jgi:hypothetical protein
MSGGFEERFFEAGKQGGGEAGRQGGNENSLIADE